MVPISLGLHALELPPNIHGVRWWEVGDQHCLLGWFKTRAEAEALVAEITEKRRLRAASLKSPKETAMIEIHLFVKADTVAQALAELGFGAVRVLGAVETVPTPPNGPPDEPQETASTAGNGAGPPPAEKRTRKAKAPPAEASPAPETMPTLSDVIKELTEVYMGGDPTARARITEFRDGHGVQRLRELKPEALAGAMALLNELREGSGP